MGKITVTLFWVGCKEVGMIIVTLPWVGRYIEDTFTPPWTRLNIVDVVILCWSVHYTVDTVTKPALGWVLQCE